MNLFPTLQELREARNIIKRGDNKENRIPCARCELIEARTRHYPCGHSGTCWDCAPLYSHCTECSQSVVYYTSFHTVFNGNSIIGRVRRVLVSNPIIHMSVVTLKVLTSVSEIKSRSPLREIPASGNLVICSHCPQGEVEVWLSPCAHEGVCWYCLRRVLNNYPKCFKCGVTFNGFSRRFATRLRSPRNNFQRESLTS
jgi:hypothetical protein